MEQLLERAIAALWGWRWVDRQVVDGERHTSDSRACCCTVSQMFKALIAASVSCTFAESPR
eukprot:361200-Chlamydomonas_euryale.AAC.4